MGTLAHFDCHCHLGRHLLMKESWPETADELLAAMDHFGIAEALVIDPLAMGGDPVTGNQQIVERTRDYPRLHPAWVGLTTHSRETPPPNEMVAQMRELGVGALYLFYGQFAVSLADWAIDDLLAALEAARVPLFLCPNPVRDPAVDQTDWDSVVRIGRDFPELPVVVTENRIYGGQRYMYEGLAACPNLRVDLTGIWLHKRIEFICKQFGADRLVWSSRMPARTPGASKMQLDYSDLSPDELAAIAGGNMRDLLSWNANIEFTTDVAYSEPVDDLHRIVRERLPLRDETFYDCHGHIGWGSNRHVIQDKPEDIVAEMDKLGVRSICVFSFAGSQPDEVYGNNECAKLIQAYPDRFVGFTMVNPHRGAEAMLEELERGLTLGMQGIKFATSFQGYPDDGPLVDVACKFADDHGQFVLHHNWGSAQQMRRLCETYPNTLFISGHSAAHYVEVARDCPNLYICSCPFHGWGQTEAYVEMYGADRILFGSDLMDLPIAWGLGPILYARITGLVVGSAEHVRLHIGGRLQLNRLCLHRLGLQ